MSTLDYIPFQVYGLDGHPLSGAAGSWVGVDVSRDVPVAAPPYRELGGGRYVFSRMPSMAAHVAGIFDFGPSAHPQSRWQVYDAPTEQNSDIVFALRNSGNQPITGVVASAQPSWAGPTDVVTNRAIAAPAISEFTNCHGLYRIPDIAQPGQNIVGLADFGSDVATRFFEYLSANDSSSAQGATTPSASAASSGSSTKQSIRNLAIDKYGDLVILNGQLQTVSGAQSIAQAVQCALYCFQGEWFLDTTLGFPYFERLYIKNPNKPQLLSLLRKIILDVEGITGVQAINLTIDNGSRSAAGTFTASSDEGLLENIPFSLSQPTNASSLSS